MTPPPPIANFLQDPKYALVQNLRMFKKKEGASDRTFINNKQVASYLKIGGGEVGQFDIPRRGLSDGGGGRTYLKS